MLQATPNKQSLIQPCEFSYASCPRALLFAQKFRAVFGEWDVGFGFGQCVCSELRPLEVLQIDYMAIDLLYHVVDACQEVFAALVVARELLCEGDERLVIHV